MAAFKHVMVPVDFSVCSNSALELALDIAQASGAKVTLVHAVYTPPTYYAAYSEGFYWPLADIEREEKRALDELHAKTKERYPDTDALLVKGKPWRMILETSAKLGADLIVMGTTGRTGLAHMLLGSVAEKVVRASPIPVLTACVEGSRKLLTEMPAIAKHA